MTDGALRITNVIGGRAALRLNARMRRVFYVLLVFTASAGCSKVNPFHKDCDAGMRAAQVETVDGRNAMTIASCDDGAPTLTVRIPPRYERKYPITPDAWDAFWQRAKLAKWRELSADCRGTYSRDNAAHRDLVEGGVSRLGVVISDGSTVRTFDCDVETMTSQQVALSSALDELEASDEE